MLARGDSKYRVSAPRHTPRNPSLRGAYAHPDTLASIDKFTTRSYFWILIYALLQFSYNSLSKFSHSSSV
ncbi:hypothetical protein L1987_04065 [Smallanthus sonchifolius]|uniref:Uncharacterized protein n=1 Tax=Smallanthus sonchifolius TaxID=185202 RepID=A0ACB9KCH1_9ASTR|nr:hypothetical protein L1987_04065 [Smallanthus sonchifolius]